MATLEEALLQGVIETQIEDRMWYLDIGATSYMIGDQNLFNEFIESLGGVVKFNDSSSIDISGKGSILVSC